MPRRARTDDLIDAAEVARLYAVKPSTIRAWACRNDPRLPAPAIRYGERFVRWRRSDVLARIEALADGSVVPLQRRASST